MDKYSHISTPMREPFRKCSIADQLKRNAEGYPDYEICIQKHLDGSRSTITFRELYDKAEKLALHLVAKGLQKGDHVALVGPNSFEWIIAEFGIIIAGGVSVHAALHAKNGKELTTTLKELKCKGVLFDPGNDKNSTVVDAISSLFKKSVNALDATQESPILILLKTPNQSVPTLQDLVTSPLEDPSVVLPILSPNDTAVIFTTSGSTGVPKMAEMTHFAIVNATTKLPPHVGTSQLDVINYNDRPFSWIGGTPLLFILRKEKRVFTDTAITLKGDNSEYLWQTIKEEKCTHCLLSPFVLTDLLKNKEKLKEMNYRMKVISTGGQMIGEQYSDIIGNFCDRFVVLYGSTEVNITTHGKPLAVGDAIELGNVGKPFPGVEVRIADENGKAVPIGEQGEVQVKSHFILKKYCGRPDLDKTSFAEGNWFRTGDVGVINANGDIIVKGKTKDVIKRGTENVICGYVEGVVQGIEGLQEVVVIGVPDNRLLEEVCACFVCKEGYNKTAEDVEKYCKDLFVTSSEVLGDMPGKFLKFNSFPRLSTGKPDKVKIKKEALERLNKSDCEWRYVGKPKLERDVVQLENIQAM